MCLNDKLSHNIKIKSRTAELYILKKEDFLRLSVNFKDIIQLFLHNSLLKYVKFNDEKKKIIKEYEDKYGIVKHNSSSATIKDKEKEIIKLDQIREETDDEENLNQGDSSDNESSDGEISLKRSRIKKTRTNDHTRLSDYEPSSEKNMSDINNNNKIDLEIQTDAEPKKVERKSNIYSHSPKNFSPNRLNNTSNDPIKEMNNHVELVKNELFIGFSEKVDRIIQFLESNNINFGEENQQNPMYYLQKLRTTKEISDRNEIIEELESVLSKYY